MGCASSAQCQEQPLRGKGATNGEPIKTLLSPRRNNEEDKLAVEKQEAAQKLGDFLAFDDLHSPTSTLRQLLHYEFLREEFESFPIEDPALLVLVGMLHGKL